MSERAGLFDRSVQNQIAGQADVAAVERYIKR